MKEIYVLKDDNVPFYIGQSRNAYSRYKSHRSMAKKLANHRDIRINDILINGRSYTYEVLCKCDVKDANKIENETITKYKEDGLPIINILMPTIDPIQLSASSPITSFEILIIKMIAKEFSIKKMSKQTGKSVRTIETIRRRIKSKFNVNSLGALIYKAYKAKLIR